MKKTLLFSLLLLICLAVQAQEADSHATLLDTYIDEHPQTVRINFIYEGCNLSVSADSSNLFVQLFITNPMLQMRLLMQECFLFIDPTGKRKEKYAIILPSAKYVKGFSGDAAPRPTSSDQRPDLSGLITMLNLYGAEWDINGRATQLHSDRFRLVFSAEQEALVYTALVSREAFRKEKNTVDEWNFGLYSPIDGSAPSPNGPMPDRNNRPANGGGNIPEDDAKLRQFLSKAIRQWVSISIKEIESSNDIDSSKLFRDGSNSDEDNIEVSLIQAGDTLSIEVSSKDKAVHRGFIMQGLHLCLRNASNDSIEISFPSAFDVKDKISHHPNEVTPHPLNGKAPSQPDMRYLLAVLNDTTIVINSTVDVALLTHGITAQTDVGNIRFKAQLLVKDFVTDGKATVSVLSAPSEEMMQNPEFEGNGKEPPLSDNLNTISEGNHIIRKTYNIDLQNAQ